MQSLRGYIQNFGSRKLRGNGVACPQSVDMIHGDENRDR
jgi:hypothetical protein